MKKTILVGDIGSTKSTWWYRGIHDTGIHLTGYNPLAHKADQIEQLINALSLQTSGTDFSAIYYYGAGIINETIGAELRSKLQSKFPNTEIYIASDLTGAAFAACGELPGTVAILGTGSHAANWDAHKIVSQANSLGYILGDEGGGCDIGKALIQAYFHHELPEALTPSIQERIPGGRAGLLTTLNNHEAPNRFLAEFAQVAVMHKDHLWVQSLVSSRFDLFIRRYLLPLPPHEEVHIVGSIGCIFASLIKTQFENNGLIAGKFIKDPAYDLYVRHLEYGKK